jgi:hypothetical protein
MTAQPDARHPVPPVAHDGDPRPFWSVMIPTYNAGEHLLDALRSVLAQDPGPDRMQIEVVDDHSTQVDAEPMVRDLAGDRVRFHRQPSNVGHSANFNTCLERARGEVVHILHDDDHVLPGFYAALEPAYDDPHVGAAFARFIYAHGDGHWHSMSPLESREAGIIPDFLARIARGQRITTPCITARRSVYEVIGGFDTRFRTGGEDWEMWVRIAAATRVWFEPTPLAVYRMHRPGSLTGNAQGSAKLARDMLLATDVVETYLGEALGAERADAALRRARSMYSRWAVEAARDLRRSGQREEAREALRVAGSGVSLPHLAARSAQVLGGEGLRRVKKRVRGW